MRLFVHYSELTEVKRALKRVFPEIRATGRVEKFSRLVGYKTYTNGPHS